MSVFSDHVSIEHYVQTLAVCDEIKHMKQQSLQYKKSMTKQQRIEYRVYRHRFEHEYNPTHERLNVFANDSYEPVNLKQ